MWFHLFNVVLMRSLWIDHFAALLPRDPCRALKAGSQISYQLRLSRWRLTSSIDSTEPLRRLLLGSSKSSDILIINIVFSTVAPNVGEVIRHARRPKAKNCTFASSASQARVLAHGTTDGRAFPALRCLNMSGRREPN